MKKLFPENKLTKKGLVEFFDKKGFYIVLILCVVIVGATAVFVTTRNIGSLNSGFEADKLLPEEANGKNVVDASSKTVAQSSISTTSNADKGTAQGVKDTSVAAAPTSTPSPTSKPSPTPKPVTVNPNFVLPVFGEVTFDYAQDKLEYSKTLGDWRSHSGVDIASDRGSQVKAVADGVVTDIKNDPRFGISITVDHQNGYKTVYANLAGEDMVTVNQKVKQGDVIGSVGNTALFESAEAPHLHFEVWKNNTLVDPKAYLPKK